MDKKGKINNNTIVVGGDFNLHQWIDDPIENQ